MPKKLSRREEIMADFSNAVRNQFRVTMVWSELMAGISGMHMTDAIAFSFLVDRRSATAGELAEVTGLTTGAVTAVVDRLESAGLVVRESHPKDRRKVIVRLNPKAIPLAFNTLRNDIMKEFLPIAARYSNVEFRRMTQFANETSALLKKKIAMMRNLKASQKRKFRLNKNSK